MDQNVDQGAPERSATRQIDGIDRALLDALVVDGRLSLTELAGQVNVSRSTAHARVQRLQDERVITGFTAVVDPHAVGLGVAALIFLDIEQHEWQSLRSELIAVPGVEYLAMCAGRFDLMLLARATDIAELRDVLLGRIQRIAGVRSSETVVVLDEVRRTGAVKLSV